MSDGHSAPTGRRQFRAWVKKREGPERAPGLVVQRLMSGLTLADEPPVAPAEQSFAQQVASGARRRLIRQRIAQIVLTVLDYDDAIDFYVNKLGFTLLEDTDLGSGKHWVRACPPGSDEAALLLARAVTSEQRTSVGNQTGGRVFLFLETDDFGRDYDTLLSRGVVFVRPPAEEPYGTVAVFKDLYGNRWDLIQPTAWAPAPGRVEP